MEVCEPGGGDESLAALLARFEDRDTPVTAPRDITEELAEARGAVDPQDEEPAVVMAVAVATYLAYRRDELDAQRDELLRLAARSEFKGRPPEHVAAWLESQGIEL